VLLSSQIYHTIAPTLIRYWRDLRIELACDGWVGNAAEINKSSGRDATYTCIQACKYVVDAVGNLVVGWYQV
jgi:hypothetical protein